MNKNINTYDIHIDNKINNKMNDECKSVTGIRKYPQHLQEYFNYINI
jgi:hypothetical protein